MAMLQCEVCGGKLKGRPGGIYECEFCGVEYDTAWAKAKIQEIRGTVQVEGTVEVKGTVAVDTKANKENLLKRIAICAEDKEFDKIKELTEELLKIDPECGEAYLWLLMVEKKTLSVDELFCHSRSFLKGLCDHKYWKKAIRFLPQEDADQVSKKLKDALACWEKEDPLVQLRYDQIQPAQDLVHDFYGGGIAALRVDGSVYVTYTENMKWLSPVATWKGIKKLVSNRFGLLLGLGWDGNVCAVCDDLEKNKNLLETITSWCGITALSIKDESEYDVVVGLRNDGELVSAYLDPYKNEGDHAYSVNKNGMQVYFALNAKGWTDVKHINVIQKWNDSLNAVCYFVLGLTYDGRIRVSDVNNIPQISDFWEGYDKVGLWNNVKKHCWGSRYLFQDGSVYNSYTGEEDKDGPGGPYLDYYITQNGVTDIGPNAYGYEICGAVAMDSNVALLADGRVVASYDASLAREVVEEAPWRHMVAVKECNIGEDAIIGVREDGVVLLAWESDGQEGISVEGWRLFQSLDTLEQERLETQRNLEEQRIAKQQREEEERVAQQKREEEERIAQQKREEEERAARQKLEEERRVATERRTAGLCQHCGGEFKGLFTKKCASCGKPKDY